MEFRNVLRQMSFINAKSAFFFSASAKYTLMSFLVVFLTNNGLKPGQAGLIVAIRYVVEVVGGVVMNFLMDKFPWHARKIILSFITISSLLVFSLPWFTRIQTSITNYVIVYAVLNGVAAFFDGGIIASIDTRVLHVTKRISPHLFVKQRIWVSIGLGFTPFITGIVVEKCKGHYFQNEALFFVIFICHAFLLLSCFSLFKGKSRQHFDDVMHNEDTRLRKNTDQKDESENSEKDYQVDGDGDISKRKSMCSKQSLALALLSYLLVGIGFMFQYTFVFSLLEVELNASKTMMGFGALLQALSEVFSASFGCILAKVFKNDLIPLPFAYFGFAIAFFVYYFVDKIWIMLTINMIVGASYSIFLYPAANIIYKNTKENNRGVTFSIALALLNGVGGCIASLLGGYLFQIIGGRKTFFGGASLFGVIGVLFLIISMNTFSCCAKLREKSTQKQKEIILKG